MGRLEKLRHAKPGAGLGELAMAAWLDRIDLSAHGYYKARARTRRGRGRES